MTSRGRWAKVASVLAMAVAVGYEVGGAAGQAGPKGAVSACAELMGDGRAVATWSPNGKRIAFVGRGLRSSAICLADASGRHAQPLRPATCRRSGYCGLINTPAGLYWLRPKRLVYGDLVKGIFAVRLGGKPKRVGASTDTYGAFSVDARGDRGAYGSPSGPTSTGPLTVLSVPRGRVVGTIGGSKVDNTNPSLSPDGKQVAFVGVGPPGVWIASAAGGDLRPLKQCYSDPVWSPSAKWIACTGGPASRSGLSLLLVSPQSGATLRLVPQGLPSPANGPIFGWSPNGMDIAFSSTLPGGQLALDVVNLATATVRQRLGPPGGSGSWVAWSPDSRELLVTTDCTLWRVPASGTKKPRRLLRANCSQRTG